LSQSDKPVKIVLTATICLVASSALQGTTTTAQADPVQQWKTVQLHIEMEGQGFEILGPRPLGPGTYPALSRSRKSPKVDKMEGPRPLGPGTYPALSREGPRPLGPGTYPALSREGPRPLGPGTYPALSKSDKMKGPRPLGPGTYPAL